MQFNNNDRAFRNDDEWTWWAGEWRRESGKRFNIRMKNRLGFFCDLPDDPKDERDATNDLHEMISTGTKQVLLVVVDEDHFKVLGSLGPGHAMFGVTRHTQETATVEAEFHPNLMGKVRHPTRELASKQIEEVLQSLSGKVEAAVNEERHKQNNPAENSRHKFNNEWFTWHSGEWCKESGHDWGARPANLRPGSHSERKKERIDLKLNVDMGDIEARLAALSETALRGDLYRVRASEMFGVPVDKVTDEQRNAAKQSMHRELYSEKGGVSWSNPLGFSECDRRFWAVDAAGGEYEHLWSKPLQFGKSYHQWMDFLRHIKSGKNVAFIVRGDDGKSITVGNMAFTQTYPNIISMEEGGAATYPLSTGSRLQKGFDGTWKVVDPTPGSVWRHYNGRKYKVLFLTNDVVQHKGHPIDVVYERIGGGKTPRKYSRPLSDWHRSFTLVYDGISDVRVTKGDARFGGLSYAQPVDTGAVKDSITCRALFDDKTNYRGEPTTPSYPAIGSKWKSPRNSKVVEVISISSYGGQPTIHFKHTNGDVYSGPASRWRAYWRPYTPPRAPTIQTFTVGDVKPAKGSIWRRRTTGTEYRVLFVTNNETDTQVIATTARDNGFRYSTPLSDWHKRFTQSR